MPASHKSLTISQKVALVKYNSLKEEQKKATTMEEVEAVFESAMIFESEILQDPEIQQVLIENPGHDTTPVDTIPVDTTPVGTTPVIGIKKMTLSQRSSSAPTLTATEANETKITLKQAIKDLVVELNQSVNDSHQTERSAIQKRVAELDEKLRQLEILLITEVTEDNLVSLPAQINKIQNELAMSKSTLIKDTNSKSKEVIAAIAELEEKAKVLLILGTISKFKIELAKLQELKPNSSQEYEDAMSKIKEYSEKVGVEASNYKAQLSETHPEYKAEFKKLQAEAQQLQIHLTEGFAQAKEMELNKKRTFARYLFKPMPKDGKPKLQENVIYFSTVDDCVLCQGLGPKDNPYEEDVSAKPSSVLNDQLINRDFQHAVLNKLMDRGSIPYNVQPDWELSLGKLRDALNKVKGSISDRDDDFHKELANVGIIYKNGEYTLKLDEAKSFVQYRDYICDIDSLIAAEFDEKAAQERDVKLKKLHADQFSFRVVYPDVKDHDLTDVIIEVQAFFHQVFLPGLKKITQDMPIEEDRKHLDAQDMLIEEDRKYLEEHDAYVGVNFKKARADIESHREQQSLIFEASEQQKKLVRKFTVSKEKFQKEEQTLQRYKKLDDEIKNVEKEQQCASESNRKEILNIGDSLVQVSDKNDAIADVDEKIRREKAARSVMRKAIDELISTHNRFAVIPNLLTWISRSPRTAQLAKDLAAIKNDIKDPNMTIKEITEKLRISILLFEGKGDVSDLIEFRKSLDEVPDTIKDSQETMNSLLMFKKRNSVEQNDIITENISRFKKKIEFHDAELQVLSTRKSKLEKEILDLQPKVEAITDRREKENAENDNLAQVEKLQTKSSNQQYLDEKEIEWLKTLSEKVAQMEVNSDEHKQALVQRQNEMESLSKDSKQENIQGKGASRFFGVLESSFRFSNMSNHFGELQSEQPQPNPLPLSKSAPS